MPYYLYKLKFPYGVHFGADKSGVSLEKTAPNCHCDTFYSALCHEILKLHGEEELSKFYNETVDGEFLFSDLLPYKNDDLMIPKPILFIEKNENEKINDSVKKKKMKKLQFIPILKLKDFFNGNIEAIDFCKTAIYEKNAPSRDGDDTKNGLYSVSVTRFFENCGLYFIVKIEKSKKDWFDNILKSLSYSGLGGKRTSGYGQFEIINDFELEANSRIENKAICEFSKLLNIHSEYYLSLSAFYPKKNEIQKLKTGYYTLIQRQGFVQSSTYSNTLLKKIPITMVNAGSCFKEKFIGDIIDVHKGGNHPVYRYGKPIMIGIDVCNN